MLVQTILHNEVEIEEHEESSLYRAGFYIRGYWHCQTLEQAVEAIDSGELARAEERMAEAWFNAMATQRGDKWRWNDGKQPSDVNR